MIDLESEPTIRIVVARSLPLFPCSSARIVKPMTQSNLHLLPLPCFGFLLAVVCLLAHPARADEEGEALPEALAALVFPDSRVTRIASGMQFTEGPVWILREQRLVWSDIPNSLQMQWTQAKGVEAYRKVAASNGNLLDLDGNLLTCQHAGRNLIRTDPDGKITVLVDRYDGKKLNSPNDLAIHSDGTIWFTDPTYGLKEEPSEIGSNNVYRFNPESKELHAVCSDFDMPNGIAFSHDEKRVFISDTGRIGTIRVFDIPKSGASLTQPIFEIDIRCDGMCVDSEGNLYTTSQGGVHVFAPDGSKLGLIPVAEQPANVCFGGADFQTLFITARSSVYSIPLRVSGARPAKARW